MHRFSPAPSVLPGKAQKPPKVAKHTSKRLGIYHFYNQNIDKSLCCFALANVQAAFGTFKAACTFAMPHSKTERLAVDYLVRIVVMRRPADVFALCLRNQHRFLPEARGAQQNPAVAAHGLHARIVLPNGVQAAFDAAVGQFGGQLRLQRGNPLDFLLHFGGAAVVGILRGQQEQHGNGGDCAEAEGGEGLFGGHGSIPMVGCWHWCAGSLHCRKAT